MGNIKPKTQILSFGTIIYLINFALATYLMISLSATNPKIPSIKFWTLITVIVITTMVLVWLVLHAEKSYYLLLSVSFISFLNLYTVLFLEFNGGYLLFRGLDSYIDYSLVRTIVTYGHISPHTPITAPEIYRFPLLHILSASISLVSGFHSLVIVSKYLPMYLTGISVLMILLLSRHVVSLRSKKHQVTYSILSALIYTTTYQVIFFHSLFVRETYAAPIFLLGLWLFIKMYWSNSIGFDILFIVSLLSLTLGHHLTSFIYILSIGSLTMVLLLFSKSSKKTTKALLVFGGAMITIFGYWTFVVIKPLGILATDIPTLLGLKTSTLPSYAELSGITTPIVTIRGKIIYYGFQVTHIITSIIFLTLALVWGIFPKERKSTPLQYLLWVITMFYLLEAITYISMFTGNLGPYPKRYLAFAWVFGAVGYAMSIKYSEKNNKQSRLYISRKGIALVIIWIVMFNIYLIPPEYYTSKTQRDVIPIEGEITIAKHVHFTRQVYAHTSFIGIVFVEQNGTRITPISCFFTHRTTLDPYVIIREKLYYNNLNILKEKNPEEYERNLMILSLKYYENKIYDVGQREYLIYT